MMTGFLLSLHIIFKNSMCNFHCGLLCVVFSYIKFWIKLKVSVMCKTLSFVNLHAAKCAFVSGKKTERQSSALAMCVP